MAASEERISRFQYLIIGVVLLGLLAFLVMPAMQSARVGGPIAPCYSNLRSIRNAMHYYLSDYGCFPPAFIADDSGQRMHSWRVLLLPYLDQEAIYQRYRFDEPWNGPHNRLLANEVIDVFHCPEDDTSGKTDASYLAVVGENTAFPGTACRKFEDFPDGASNTILLVETAGSGIHWMEPRDLSYEDALSGINSIHPNGISSRHGHPKPGGARILYCDGSVRFLENNIPQEVLRWLLEVNDGHEIPDF